MILQTQCNTERWGIGCLFLTHNNMHKSLICSRPMDMQRNGEREPIFLFSDYIVFNFISPIAIRLKHSLKYRERKSDVAVAPSSLPMVLPCCHVHFPAVPCLESGACCSCQSANLLPTAPLLFPCLSYVVSSCCNSQGSYQNTEHVVIASFPISSCVSWLSSASHL